MASDSVRLIPTHRQKKCKQLLYKHIQQSTHLYTLQHKTFTSKMSKWTHHTSGLHLDYTHPEGPHLCGQFGMCQCFNDNTKSLHLRQYDELNRRLTKPALGELASSVGSWTEVWRGRWQAGVQYIACLQTETCYVSSIIWLWLTFGHKTPTRKVTNAAASFSLSLQWR